MGKVKLLIGSHGSGKSEYIYKLLYKNSFDENGQIDLNKKLYLIVPEQDTQEKQKKMMQVYKDNGKGFINLDVISFDRLCYNVFNLLDVDIDKNKMVQDDAKTLILRLAISNLKDKNINFPYFEKSLRKLGFYEKLTSCMSEFYTYNIGKKELELVCDKINNNLLKQKINELSLIQEEFLFLLNKKGFKIKEDKLNLLRDLLPKTNTFDDAIVCFDGFTGFTPIQRDIFKEICKKSKQVFLSIDYRLSDFNNNDYKENNNQSANSIFDISKLFIKQIKNVLNDINLEFKTAEDLLIIKNGEVSDINNNYVGTEQKYNDKAELSLIEQKLFQYNNKSEGNKKESNQVEIYQLKNTNDETTFLIKTIERLIREEKCKYNDIRVIVPNVDDYRDFIINKAEKYNIPIFIDDSHTILNSPYIEAIRSALEVVDTNFSQQSVERYINAGIIHKNKKYYLYDSAIRKYILNNKFKFKTKLDYVEEDIKYKLENNNYKIYDYVDENIININELNKQLITPLIVFSDNIFTDKKNKCTISHYNKAILDFIKNINLAENFDNIIKSGTDNLLYTNKELSTLTGSKEVFDKTINLLSIISDDEEIELREYRNLMDLCLQNTFVKSIPYTLDQVIVGDLMRSRYDNPKYLIFMGLNDSNIPKSSNDNNIINDEMRNVFEQINEEVKKENNDIRLELSQTTIETTLNSRFYVYLALTNPTEKLILTWTSKNAENITDQESSVIKDVKQILNIDEKKINIENQKLYNISNIKEYVANNIYDTKVLFNRLKKSNVKNIKNELISDKDIFVKAKVAKDLFNFLNNDTETKQINKNMYENNKLIDKNNINQNLLNKISNYVKKDDINTFVSSASRIEDFASCPYRYFINDTLGLSKLNTIELSAIDIGNVFHTVLEKFFVENNINSCSENDIITKITKLCDETVNKNNKFDESNRSMFMINRLKDIIVESVLIMKKQSSLQKEFKTIACEYGGWAYNISDENCIQGRIDKIDVVEDDENIYLRVIDYKSGSINVDNNLINAGVKIQFLIYLDYCYNHYNEIKTALKIEGTNKKIIPIGSFYSRIFDNIKIYNENDKKNNLLDNKESNYKLSGILNEDAIGSILLGDDKTAYKNIYDINKNLCLTNDEIVKKLESAKEVINSNISKIKQGDVSVKPYSVKEVCEYCEYSAICKNEFILNDEEDNDGTDD